MTTSPASRVTPRRAEPRRDESRARSTAREYGEALLVALLLALFIRTFVVQAFKIPSGSMLPTLQIGDHILVNKFVYGIRLPFFDREVLHVGSPRRGDIVVFIYPVEPEKDFIKRVVGVAGDRIEVRDKRLWVNGERAEDPWANWVDGNRLQDKRDNYGPYVVPDGMIFVMGDNRDRSYDSRFWGPVELAKVKGKAFLIYWSWDGPWNDLRVRWGRIGRLVY